VIGILLNTKIQKEIEQWKEIILNEKIKKYFMTEKFLKYPIGGNEQSAFLMGLQIVKILIFINCGKVQIDFFRYPRYYYQVFT
jgi:hypothetical protein